MRSHAQGVRLCGDRGHEERTVVVGGHDRVDEERKKLYVVLWGFPRSQQIDSCIGEQRPVAVLTRSVDSGERLFVEQDAEFMLLCQTAH